MTPGEMLLLLFAEARSRIPAAFSRPRQVALYQVYDGLGSTGRFPGTRTFKGQWIDASFPEFSESASQGVSDITVTLPDRIYGAAGEPSESDSPYAATLQHGYGVDVLMVDTASLLGASADPSSAARVVYRGTIRSVTFRPLTQEVEVRIGSLGRIAEQTYHPAPATYPNGSYTHLKGIVLDYLPGLDWDAANTTTYPFSTGTYIGRVPMAQAIRDTVKAGGSDWIAYVGATGNVRVFQQTRSGTGRTGNAGSARHTWLVGSPDVPAEGVELTKTIEPRVRSVILEWAGGVVTASAVGLPASDPEANLFTRPDITDSTVATNTAANLLAALNRVTLAARVRVNDSYPGYQDIRVGDAARLLVPRATLGTGSSFEGYQDYNTTDLLVMARSVHDGCMDLELDMEVPRLETLTKTIKKDVDQLKVDTYEALWKSESGIAVAPLETSVKTAGVQATGDPAGVASTVTFTGVISGDDIKVKVGTTDRKITTSAWP